jgi:choline dehydrogenase-like flavoprotein
MIIDAQKIDNEKVIESDICIVGAGVAGIALACEFLDTRYSVTIVESGGLEPNTRMQSLNAGKNTGVPYYDLDRARIRAFGGTSHSWHCELGGAQLGVRLIGLDEIDFEKRDWVPNSGWPFSKRELDPYYEKAHRFCKIGPYSYELELWKNLLPAEDRPLLNSDTPVQTKIFQFAQKELWYEKYREVIQDSKNITAYINATVLNVITGESGRITEHLEAGTNDGKRLRFRAGKYILAPGGIETPRLMLLSNTTHHKGLGNQHDKVGRYFMEHPHIWSGYIVPSRRDLINRINLYKVHSVHQTPVMGKLALSAETQRKERLLNFTTSIHPVNKTFVPEGVVELKKFVNGIRGMQIGGSSFRHLTQAVKNIPDLLGHGYRKFRRTVDRRYKQFLREPNVLILNVMAEQVPNPESRVVLNNERDLFGQNRVSLNWHLTSQDINSIRRSQHLLGEELKGHGIGELIVELKDDSVPPDIHGGWHHMGTTRMHTDPKSGVVDENCRVHGIANLFIAGASVFPTVGYANPVLTTIALSMRLADYLKLNGGHND